MSSAFKKDQVIRQCCEEIAAIEPCAFAGRVTPDQVMLVLCERLDIWPASIAGDPQCE